MATLMYVADVFGMKYKVMEDIMSNVIEIKNLIKSYGGTKAVDNFELTIERGRIYGLIGPNGSGKTTTMRMIAGLTNPDSGKISLFGQSNNLDAVRNRVSFMIEAPYIEGSMTAQLNMEYMSAIRGVNNPAKVKEILEFVGLADTGKKMAKNFSLGMRQRLGIGMALVSDPEIMILDEPINGLDPEGIVEIRKKLLMLSQEKNTTILISSHLLSELYELCTDFTFIYKGKLIENISREELERKCKTHLIVQSNNMSGLLSACKNFKLQNVNLIDGDLHIYDNVESVEEFSKFLYESGVVPTKLILESEKLEDYYLKKVGIVNE